MKKNLFVLFLMGFLAFGVIGTAGATSFSDNFDDGYMNGWTQKIGSWSVGSEYNLSNNGSDYGVVWKDNSLGVYQKIQVDAYFDFSGDNDNKYAHLRLRTNENTNGSQLFWDTGYLAQFHKDGITIQNTHMSSNPIVASVTFSTPFTDAGWYTLTFGVDGTGTNTHFSAWVNDTKYIDQNYNNTIAELDSGYVGLGRKIRYDNVKGYSSAAPVPEPSTILLLGSGLAGLAFYRRKRK